MGSQIVFEDLRNLCREETQSVDYAIFSHLFKIVPMDVETESGVKQIPGSAGERELQKQFGTQDRAEKFYARQMLTHLNPRMQAFIALQEMVFIATADAKGNCDSSLRSGTAGFVRIISPSRLAYPEYRGNGVLASLGNLYENAYIGMMFVDFFRDKIGLHVNGAGQILENNQIAKMPDVTSQILSDIHAADGRKPQRWILVDIHEAYIHCSKHIPLLTRTNRPMPWGTDDTQLKGGDFFEVAGSD